MGTPAFLLAVKALATVGGAVIGGLALGLLVRVIGRWFSSRGAPRWVVRLMRGLGAVAAGCGVWFIVSGEGGGWGGAGGALLGGRGEGSNTGKRATAVGPTGEERPTARSAVRPGPDTLQVIMLGGDLVAEGRFYVIDGDPKRLTLPELKQAVKTRQEAGLNKIEILIYGQSVAENHQAVRDLRQWAEQNNLTAVLVREQGDLRERVRGGS